MIQTSTGGDVENFLTRVLASPDHYLEVVICSPFIDGYVEKRLVSLAQRTREARCGLRIITSPAAAARLRESLPGHPASWTSVVISRGGLHAKVYLALARCRRVSEVIVTSANLTGAGVETNIELGVRARPSSNAGSNLLSQVHHFLQQLAANNQQNMRAYGGRSRIR